MMKLVLLLALGLASGPAQAQADPAVPDPLLLCPQAILAEQGAPSDAVEPAKRLLATFPPAADGQSACTLPLAYVPAPADGHVLITQRFVEGGECHGCAATLSAHFFLNDAPIASHWGFAANGTFGRAGRVTGVMLAPGRLGLAIESESTFQGYKTSGLELFEFRDDKAVAVLPFTVIGKSDCEAVEGVCDNIQGLWEITPEGELQIRFTGTYNGKEIELGMLVTYRLVGEGFQLVEGELLEPY
jgi:hypothetical protein